MIGSDIVPLRHVRGTLLTLRGHLLDGGEAADFAALGGLLFHIVDPDTWTTLRDTTSATVTTDVDGVEGDWQITLAGSHTLVAVLPKDEYWYQVTVKDEAGAPHALVRGPLTLEPAPSGLGG